MTRQRIATWAITTIRALTTISTAIVIIIIGVISPAASWALDGRIIDAQTGQPILGAVVTAGEDVVSTDAAGLFGIDATGSTLAARAPGYRRTELCIAPDTAGSVELRLEPFRPKALYLSFYGIGDKALRGAALELIDRTELNALVIDVKGDRGMIPYKSSVALAREIGAQRITTVRDVHELIESLRGRGIYLIARIVVFKDDLLAQARPDLAVKTTSGALWRDHEQLAWVDPFRQEVWNYNLEIAEEAAALGFDEIQFDYVRLPDASDLAFSQISTEESRVAAIAGFLVAAKRRLAPYTVFVAADLFGYVCWNLDDTHIGQRLETLAPILDYLSPMLYPSGFQYGIPGFRDPVAHPREIVALSLQRAIERTGLSPLRFRPWLQAFRDYAFDRREITEKEIRLQITAAESLGSDGWMLWNPHNTYSATGLRSEVVLPTPLTPAQTD